jgi:tubulin delta
LRGNGSQHADVNTFAHESLYPIWSVDPLNVAVNEIKLGNYEMAAGLLSNCQSTVMPASRVLPRAYGMYSARAYLHQYFEHGMDNSSFDAAFATVEDIVARYLAL